VTSWCRLRGEDGFTLVESLTAMAISAVVLGVVGGTIFDATRAQRRETTRVSALNDSKLAFERVTRDIRRADPLQAAELDRVRLDVRAPDGSVRTVTYERAGESLVATDAASGDTRALVGDLAPGQPVFLFHLTDGSTVTGEAPVNPRAVRSVTVQLRVEPDGAGRVVDLANRVLVRNVRS
jgi:prepilin-type N-terminal cleavage/methylation domain-containing protein